MRRDPHEPQPGPGREVVTVTGDELELGRLHEAYQSVHARILAGELRRGCVRQTARFGHPTLPDRVWLVIDTTPPDRPPSSA